MRLVLCFLIAGLAPLAAPASAQTQQVLFPGQSGEGLNESVRGSYQPSANQIRSSGATKDLMMYPIWTVDEGSGIGVRGVYTGWFVPFDNDPPGNANQEVFNGGADSGLNQEHVWPRSRLGSPEVSERDMHHLFPSRVDVNSDRGSLPFAEIDDSLADDWYADGVETTSAPTADRDLYSERDREVAFEPRESVKGDVARAMFYVATMYPSEADLAWFQGQARTLYDWHNADRVDAAEFQRTLDIAGYQGGTDRENPFVLDSTLARRAFFPDIQATRTDDADPNRPALAVASGNPFTTEARLTLTLPGAATVRADAFDALGRRVAVLWDGPAPAGATTLRLDGAGLASGVYLVRARVDGVVLTRVLARAR